MKLKQALQGKLSEKELSYLKTAFDIVGDIAILEMDKRLEKKERIIAQTLLDSHKNIKVVLKKVGGHSGKLRTQKMKVLAGQRRKETVHKESNTIIKLHVEKVYFSVRLSTERLRIAEQVKHGEEILVMFSGCAPYPCVLSRNTKAKHIWGVELNKEGYKYGLENVKLNKIKNVTLLQGDVRKKVPELVVKRGGNTRRKEEKAKFDRVLMPLPKTGEEFLDIALQAVRKKGIIHFYDFLPEIDIPEVAIEKIKKACSIKKRKYKILKYTRCGSNAPRTFRICVDFRAY
jgi:tRNA (guanine37-N1)-methyltransferase